MSATTEKIIGYLLFGLGLFCIIFAVYSVYTVFTNVSNPPQVFNSQSVSLSVSSPEAGRSSADVQITLDDGIKKTVNTFLYYLFMFFILSAGSQIAGLGIKFIKEKSN
jgi:hypothetical protein